jgi:hypothetical protein
MAQAVLASIRSGGAAGMFGSSATLHLLALRAIIQVGEHLLKVEHLGTPGTHAGDASRVSLSLEPS